MVSPRPSWLACASMITGVPPSWAMPTSNETRVRVLALSNSTATAFGPASGLCAERIGLHRDGQLQHLGLLGRGEVVVAQEVPRHRAASRIPGSAMRNSSACASVSTSGGASRTRSGTALLTRNPAARAWATTAADTGPGQQDADQQAGAVDAADQRVPQPLDGRRDALADERGVLQQPVGGDRVEHRQRRGRADRVAAERGAVLAGLEQLAPRRRGRCTPRWAARRRGPWPA